MQPQTQPRRGRAPELHTGDLSVGQAPDLILPDLNTKLAREPEAIVAVDSPMENDHMKELAFMEEPVTIRLERSNEKFAPELVDVYVNGRVEWIPVGRPYTVARKYVEVLLRAKADNVQTIAGKVGDENPENRITRFTSSKYPFSVIQDNSPRGAAWMTRIQAER